MEAGGKAEFNTHHNIWTRRDCEKLGRAAIWLREQHDLTPTLEIQTHQQLHEETLPFKLSKEFYDLARGEWENNGRFLEAIYRLMRLVERLEPNKRLANHALESLESQIEYIEYGLKKGEL